MKISAKVSSVDLSKAIAKAGPMERRVKTLVTLAAREDTKPFVPKLNNDLRTSAETESKPEEGLLIYGNADVPYARKQYYEYPNKTYPGTQVQWFEPSKAQNMASWIAIAQQAAGKVANG